MCKVLKLDAMIILSTVLALSCLYAIFNIRDTLLGQSERHFYYSAEGGYIEAHSSKNPRFNDSKTIAFAERVVGECLSVDVASALAISDGDASNGLIKCVHSNFLPIAASSLFKIYPSDNLIEVIIDADAKAFAVVPYPASIISRNKPNEKLKWVIMVPITVTVQSLSTDQTTSFLIKLTIIPDITAPNPSNLIISRASFL